MTRWFTDYRWSKQSLVGVGEYETRPGVAHFFQFHDDECR